MSSEPDLVLKKGEEQVKDGKTRGNKTNKTSLLYLTKQNLISALKKKIGKSILVIIN